MSTTLNIYDFTIPTLINSLTSLSAFLNKASTGPQASSLADPTTVKLIDDMRPLTFQIQSACKAAKAVPVNVASVPDEPVEDTETTWEEMQDRITKTIEFLKKVPRESFDGTDGKDVYFRDMKFTGLNYVTKFVMPNFFFHFTAAYCILRMKGVDVGKMDYLGAIRD